MNQTAFDTSTSTVRQREDADNFAHLERMKRAWQAYYGEHKKPLKVKSGKPDANVIVNYLRLVVDVGVSFLFGEPGKDKEVEFITDNEDASRNDAEAYLDTVWGANRKLTTLYKLGLNGSVCGHAFLKVMRGQGGMPRLVVLDPAHVTPEWAVDDVDELVRVTIRYETIDPLDQNKAIHYRQVIERDTNGRWLITDYRSSGNAPETEAGREYWPYAWCPVHHCQNLPDPNVFWGMSDLEDDVLRLNDATNFALSNLNLILTYHAHPKTWGKGVSADTIHVDADGTILLNNPDASLNNLEMLSDLSSSIAFFEQMRSALREVTHVPEVALGGMADASRVSSLALKVMYSPLMTHTGKKRATYGDMLDQLNMHLLEMGQQDVVRVRCRWPFVLPTDPQTDATVAVMHEQLGASKETLLRKLGYNPTLEAEQRLSEEQNLGEAILKQFDQGVGA